MPDYTNNMSLISQQDANVMQPYGYGNNQAWGNYGMNTQAMDAAQMLPNQNPQQPMTFEQKMQAMQDQQNRQNAFKMMAQGVQGMARPQAFPSANTAQIIRDQNQFRYAGNPQQQMAQALRNRG